MQTLEESVVQAMDGTDSLLFPYLPYILQDIWEIGAYPETILNLIKKHKKNHSNLKILDLGCGKGAVSIKIAKELKCSCYGVDGIKEFIEEAKTKSKEMNVEKYCEFEVGDIRTKKFDQAKYDIIILGAIGPVLGDYFTTLTKLKKLLSKDGLIILDDGYTDEAKEHLHSPIEIKSSLLKQINKAGMKLIDEDIISKEEIKKSNEDIFRKLKKRCEELMINEPAKKHLFEEYIKIQAEENKVLEQDIVCSTMVIGNIWCK